MLSSVLSADNAEVSRCGPMPLSCSQSSRKDRYENRQLQDNLMMMQKRKTTIRIDHDNYHLLPR